MVGTIEGLPPLQWLNGLEGEASIASDGRLTMVAAAKTDWFNPAPVPNSPAGLANAPALVFSPPAGDWQLSARVSVAHQYLFDAGTIFVHQGKDDWFKLCFELSPEKKCAVDHLCTVARSN